MAKIKRFTSEEQHIIRTQYFDIGAVGVAKLLVGRSRDTIKQWACKNGLKVSKKYRSEVATASNLIHKRDMSEKTRKKIGDGHRKHKPFKCKKCGKDISHYCSFCWDCYKLTVGSDGNNNWRGGISTLTSVVNQLLWPEWKYPILERDFFQCQGCGKTGSLEVHHLRRYVEIRDKVIEEHPEIDINNFYGRKEMALLIVLEHTLNDGVTLCKACHDLAHGKKRGELLEHPNASGEDNQQPSLSNVISIVDRKVQRLTLEDSQANNSDTSAPLTDLTVGVMI